MYDNIPTTIMLLCIVVFVKMWGTQQACDSGWFGEKCRFMCHCLKSPTCDMDGVCPSKDRCAPGFFGPGCQYVDLAVRSTNDTNHYLTDENESTCNNNKTATSERLSWITGVVFSWLRIYVNNPSKTTVTLPCQPFYRFSSLTLVFLVNYSSHSCCCCQVYFWADSLQNVTVKLNNNVDCPYKIIFTVSSRAVDVTCDFLSKVFTLDVIGAVAADLCSIYISGGRNVALRQPANQTSTYFNGSVSNASNAVDGNRNPILEEGHCTHTHREPVMAEWSLFFSRPCTIFEIILYNRDIRRHLLGRFTLLTYNEAGRLVFSYDEKRDPDLPSYDIQSSSRESVAVIKIRVTTDEKILTLCEVETFGEVICPEGYYGLSCQKQCTCQDTEKCFIVTGACTAGCPHGTYGPTCSSYCNPNCLHLQCNEHTGVCLSCHPGFSGPECSSPCELGTYGSNCEKNCSMNCQTPCDINNGFCQCQQPYVGKICTECPPSWYGKNCTKKCPSSCASGKCHIETGECTSCRGTSIGAFCQDCPRRFYGELCSEPCSKFCYNDTCDIKTGVCFSCTDDYTGPMCTDAPTSISIIHLFVAVGVSALVSFVGACFFLRKTDSDEGSEADSNVTTDTLQDY